MIRRCAACRELGDETTMTHVGKAWFCPDADVCQNRAVRSRIGKPLLTNEDHDAIKRRLKNGERAKNLAVEYGTSEANIAVIKTRSA